MGCTMEENLLVRSFHLIHSDSTKKYCNPVLSFFGNLIRNKIQTNQNQLIKREGSQAHWTWLDVELRFEQKMGKNWVPCATCTKHTNTKTVLYFEGSSSKKVRGIGCLQGCREIQPLRVLSKPQPPPHSKRSNRSRIGFLSMHVRCREGCIFGHSILRLIM